MPMATPVVMAQPAMLPRTLNNVQSQAQVRGTCPNCNADVTTKLSHKVGLGTWGACFVIGCFVPLMTGCVCPTFLGCCFVPFCLDATKDVKHTCPNCKTVLG